MKLLPEIPDLPVGSRILFPSPSPDEDIVAVGGNLSPGMLLSAYSQGVFPWFSPGDPLIWWSPCERMVLPLGELHVSRRMRRIRRKATLRFTWDVRFHKVISRCSSVPRGGQFGTWIDSRMIEAYTRLHHEGYAHSIEAWDGADLAGGLYGVSLGRAFFGESMFSHVPDSSKLCFYLLHDRLLELGFHMIDCQMYTPHLESLGASLVSREEYMEMLRRALKHPTITGHWATLRNMRSPR